MRRLRTLQECESEPFVLRELEPDEIDNTLFEVDAVRSGDGSNRLSVHCITEDPNKGLSANDFLLDDIVATGNISLLKEVSNDLTSNFDAVDAANMAAQTYKDVKPSK